MTGGPGVFCFSEEEKREIYDVIESGYLYRYGDEGNERFKKKVLTFEKEFAHYIDAKYALATSSGTGSLMCCLVALEIGPGDEVIVPGYTFVATLSACVQCGAIPVLAEIDDSLTLDVKDVKKKITSRTKAIIAVHMIGNPCKMNELKKIARDNNLFLIEDCCQAMGAKYQGKHVGIIGDIGAYSMNHYKVITSGDGGAVVTDSKTLYERSFAFHDQGHLPCRMGVEIGSRSLLGINFRMNELTGAVALAQLRKIERIVSTLRKNKSLLKSILMECKYIKFRTINDPEECGTVVTILFNTPEEAKLFCKYTRAKIVLESGWHVYKNMEQLINKRTGNKEGCPFSCAYYNGNLDYRKISLPLTDHILGRAINISIGVVDPGLSSDFGINILSTEDQIIEAGNKILNVLNMIY